jgi:hypothetical protein
LPEDLLDVASLMKIAILAVLESAVQVFAVRPVNA